jgi:hypothetical protein
VDVCCQVDLLPEISQAPRILSDVESALKNKQLKAEVDDYLKTRQRLSLLSVDLKGRLMLPPAEAVSSGTKYNVPLLNALVLYVGMQAIQQLQTKTTQQQLAVPSAPITHSAPMDIFQHLVLELDTEGRYLFLNAVANQLRYPNNHTHYFSCVLLYLFAEANLVSSPLPHCFHGGNVRHCSSLTTMTVWKLLSLRLSTGLCWRSHLTAIPLKAPHFVINMLILACTFSGNYTGANHKGVAGETDCK